MAIDFLKPWLEKLAERGAGDELGHKRREDGQQPARENRSSNDPAQAFPVGNPAELVDDAHENQSADIVEHGGADQDRPYPGLGVVPTLR